MQKLILKLINNVALLNEDSNLKTTKIVGALSSAPLIVLHPTNNPYINFSTQLNNDIIKLWQ